MSTSSKTIVISGSTRGIGRVIGDRLASLGHNVVITGKSIKQYSESNNQVYLNLDLRKQNSISVCRDKVIKKFGSIDVLINNASAMWWMPIEHTPINKYNLMNEVNSRGSYLLSREFIPYINEGGTIISHSPPIDPETMKLYLSDGFKNKIAYMVSKLGMSIVASGLAQELKSRSISSNCIWPSTAIDTAAMRDNKLIPPEFNNPKLWRKPDIMADMVQELLNEDNDFTNNFLIDELYLRQKGYTNFDVYQSVEGFEPPKLNELFSRE